MKEIKAEIRNKLQSVLTILEQLEKDKQVNKPIIRTAVKDLQNLIKLLKKYFLE